MKDKMRRFFDVVVAVKQRAALNYTAAMCIYVFFLWVFKQDGASLPMLFSLLVVLFFVVFGAVLTAFAVGFGWFPTDSAGAWVGFAAIFILIFAAIAGGIEIYYRASGRKWDDRLDWYRKNREKK